MTALSNAGIFLISLLFDFYLIILLLRLCMQRLGMRYFNPISQWVIKLTNPLVVPLRKVIPGYRGFDLAIVFWLIIIAFVEAFLLLWLRLHLLPQIGGVLIVAVGNLIEKTVNLFFYTIIIRFIISWIPTLQHNPVSEIVYAITEPLLQRARQLIPTIGSFDFSPILVLIVFQLISIVAVTPLLSFGMRLALS